jgi:ubiquitin-conjugating enzyme E2 M
MARIFQRFAENQEKQEQDRVELKKLEEEEEKERKQQDVEDEEEKRLALEIADMQKQLYGTSLSSSRKQKLSDSIDRRQKERDAKKKSKEETVQKEEKTVDITRKARRKPKRPPWEIRVLNELPGVEGTEHGVDGCVVKWPSMKELGNIEIYVTPNDGRWQDCKFDFRCTIPNDYPDAPPKLKLVTETSRVYHPNIDYQGNVCISILKVINSNNEGWKAVNGIATLLFGLVTLFHDPNPDDPLNHTAARMMIENPSEFDNLVQTSINGGYVDGHQFPKVYKRI